MTKHLPQETRREQILDAARRCFIDQGYSATRMADIARRAGLSKGGVYFHFSSKRALFDALVEQEYHLGVSFLKQVERESSDWRNRLERLAGHFMRFFEQRPDYPRFFMVMAEMAGRDPSIRAMLSEIQQAYFSALERLLQRGVDSGQLRNIDCRSVAQLLKGLLDAVEGYLAIGLELDTARLLASGVELISGGVLLNGGGEK